MKQFTKHPKGAQSADECQKWIDYDMEHYGRISEQTMKDIKKAGFTVTKDQYGEYEVTAAVNCSNLSHDVDEYQKWIDYDMKRYGKISNLTMKKIKDAGFTVTKDQYGDYEITASCDVKADTVKKGNKWVNRGDTGEEHGEFDTKKEADAQRRAMYAGGYKGPVKGAKDKDEYKVYDQVNGYIAKLFKKYGLEAVEINEVGDIVERTVQAILKNI